ncbi:hypothetical protein [Methylibium sp. T29]|uniref:hypothetical protein n=1 Tax=Methylibium sp. T29 TaxID=1430884 RepID=UPI0004B0E885|nr:hypothetical protein [Methylibium sp. T29]
MSNEHVDSQFERAAAEARAAVDRRVLRPLRDLAVARKLALIVFLLVGVVVGLVYLSKLSSDILSGVRATWPGTGCGPKATATRCSTWCAMHRPTRKLITASTRRRCP